MDASRGRNALSLIPRFLAGKLVIRGTRIAVEFVLELLAGGQSESELLANYPGLISEDTQAAKEERPKLIAQDEVTHRLIVAIGSQRVALDFFTRITHLPPHTGDRPATLQPMRQDAELQHVRGPGTSAQGEAKKPAQPQLPRRRKKGRPA